MKRPLAAALSLCTLLGASGHAQEAHDASFSKEGLFKADVNTLTDTRLVAHPDVPLVPSQNVLWCGTMQLAWNEAVRLVGEKLRFTTPSPAADLLNRMDFTRGDLAPDSYVAVADFEVNHVEDEIRAALQKTFHGAASPELIPQVPRYPSPEDFVAYSYLYKNLAFAHPFAKETGLHFAGTSVESFGFKASDHLADETLAQVSLYDYKSDADFIVKLQTKSADDELVLAKIPPGATLAATISDVLTRLGKDTQAVIEPDDTLAVPKLNFDLRRDFRELEGLVLVPDAKARIHDKLVIAKAEQLVRFQLNEKGAILKSEAVVTVALAMAMRPPPSHHLVFDQPFLILLKQAKSPRPYFALWVGNSTLLIPAHDPAATSEH